MAQDLGSIYASLGLKLDNFETSVNKSVQGFYKLQTGVDKSSSIMDNSVRTATNNIAKSYRVWELSNGDVAKSMDIAKNKVDSLKGQMNLLDKELSSSEKILKDIEKQCGLNSKEYAVYKGKVLDLKIEHGELTKELKNTEQGMHSVSGKLKMMEEDFSKIDTKYQAFDKIGGSVSNLGNKMTMGLTIPIATATFAATKFAMDFEDGLAKVYTIADANVVSIATMSDGIKKLSNDTGITVEDLSNNVYDAISAGQKTGDALSFVEKSARLAKAGFADAGQSLDLLTTIMNSYELQASDVTKVSDILIATQNIGKTTVGELSSSMGKIIPTAKSVGVNLEQVATGYALMTAKGIATAETTTYMASMLNELGKSGTTASDAIKKVSGKSFQELIASGKSLGDVLNIMNEYAIKNKLSLSDLFGSAEAGKAALVLSNNAGQDFNSTLTQMGQSAGSTDTAFAKVSETTKNKLKVSFNEMKNSAMALGEKLIPVVSDVIKHISNLADKFNSLSPATQESILKAALMTATLGPLLKVTGGAITGFGTLAKTTEKIGVAFGIFKGFGAATTAVEGVGVGATVTTGAMAGLSAVALPLSLAMAAVGVAFYATYETNKMLSTSCNTASEDLGFMEKAMVTLNGVTLHTKEEMKDLGIVYGEWNEDVSPETQTALTDITTKVGELKLAIQNGSGIENFITTEDGKKLQQKTDELIEGIKKKIEEKTPGVQQNLQALFNMDGIIDEEEKKSLDALNAGNKNKLEKLEEHKVKIQELEARTATETLEKRKITAIEIQTELDKIAQIGLESTVNNQDELIAAQADFNARIKTLDVNGLAEILQEKAKMRDDNIAAEKLKYDASIEALRLSLNTASESETVAINNSIAKLEKGRDDSIQKEKDKYKGFLDTAIEGNTAIITNLDLHNGTMLTNQEMAKKLEVLEYASRMDRLLGITKSGWYDIKNTTSGKMHETLVIVDEKTGEIEKVWDETLQDVKGNPITTEERINHPRIKSEFKKIEDNYDGVKDSILRNGVEVTVKETWNPFGWLTSAWTNTKNWLSNSPATVNTNYEGRMSGATQYASGTNNLGLSSGVTTTLNERGYELYQLPRGARVWNNQASEALVKQSAESTAGGILEQNKEMLSAFAASINTQGNDNVGFSIENLEQLAIYISRSMVKEMKKVGIDRPQINFDPREAASAIAPYQDEFETYKSTH